MKSKNRTTCVLGVITIGLTLASLSFGYVENTVTVSFNNNFPNITSALTTFSIILVGVVGCIIQAR